MIYTCSVHQVHTYNNPIAWSFISLQNFYTRLQLITVCTWLLEKCSTNAFGDFNVAFCNLFVVFQYCMEYGKKPVLTALKGRAHNKYLDKFPDKYSIDRTYKTIFRHHITIITLLDTLNVAMQYV